MTAASRPAKLLRPDLAKVALRSRKYFQGMGVRRKS